MSSKYSNAIFEKIAIPELKELLAKDRYDNHLFEEYAYKRGLNNIKTYELDKILEKFNIEAARYVQFGDVYNIVSNRETSKIMQNWTIAIGVMTGAMMLLTILMYFKPGL